MMNEKENHYETPQKEGENEGFEKSSDNNYPKDLTEWKKKRESTYRVFCILAIFLGAEYSMIVPSLWFYLKDVVKTDHIKFYYGTAFAIYYIAPIFSGSPISMYVDRTRNLKPVMLTLIAFEVIGSCMYAVYSSVYFQIVARFVQGFGEVNISLMTAEIARVFPREECTKKIANLVGCYAGAFVISPGLGIVFKYIDFEIAGFKVNFGNFPGLLMAVVLSCMFIVAIYKCHNLSKEYDLKEQEALKTKTKDQRRSKTTRIQFKSYDLFCKIDYVLLVGIGFMMSYSVVSFLDVAFPIISSTYFGLNSQFVSGMFLASGVVFMILLQVIKQISKNVNDFTLLLAGLCVFFVTTGLLLAVTIIKDHHRILGISLLVCFVISLGVCWCVEQVFVKTILAKMIPSEVQAFGESTRRAASSIACVLASMTTGFVIEHLYIQCVVTMFVVLMVLAYSLGYRRQQLKDAKTFTLSVKSEGYEQLVEDKETYPRDNVEGEDATSM